MTDDPRDLVATACRVLAATGHGDLIWGHASARDEAGRGVWLKAASWGLEEVSRDRVHLIDREGSILAGDGQRHSEYPIHTEIMAARSDVGGVVHVHSPHAVALSASGEPLRPVGHTANFFAPHGVGRFTDTADLILTPELGKAVAAQLGPCYGLFLVNHGIVTVGADVRTATVAAVLLEMACRQQLLTHGFGGWPSWSDPAESASKRRNIYPDHAVRAVWDYLVRTTGLSAPSRPGVTP